MKKYALMARPRYWNTKKIRKQNVSPLQNREVIWQELFALMSLPLAGSNVSSPEISLSPLEICRRTHDSVFCFATPH